MNPIYKFELSVSGVTRRVYPLYSGDLSKDYNLESGQQFFRASLNGDLSFLSDDYDYIVEKAIDTQFDVTIYVSYNGGASWAVTWTGKFWKTDCKFNEDDKTVTVKPTLSDAYTNILDGWEKEFNLIELTPVIEKVKADKRPLIQVYVPGQTVIGCFLAGMGWEQECRSINDGDALIETYHFARVKNARIVQVSGTMSPALPGVFAGSAPANETGTYSYTTSGWKFQYVFSSGRYYYQIYRVSDNTKMWEYDSGANAGVPSYPSSATLSPISGTGASGDVTVSIRDQAVYARYLCDVNDINGTMTYPLPSDDIAENNRNYHRAVGYDFPETIVFSAQLTTTPTPYGIYVPGQYYAYPAGAFYYGEFFPIAKSAWSRVSMWFTFSTIDWALEQYARSPFVLNDAYPLWSVISVLLGKIAPGITHAGTSTYSQFLYGSNPITGITTKPMITPKSNIIYTGYDQPAQRAPITLKQVCDMLRDVFRCYWYIDASNRFRIEHIKFFNNGQSYSGTPGIGVDLTSSQVPRTGKKWATGKDAYQFDKPEMASRYQFGWMDEQTQLFDGYPIEIVSNYVQKDKIESVQIQRFSSDVDYIMLNPSTVSKDGFVLLLCQASSHQVISWTQFLSVAFETVIGERATVHEVLDLSAYRGKTVRLTVELTSGSAVYGYVEDGSYAALILAGTVTQEEAFQIWEFSVPNTANSLALYSPEGATMDIQKGYYSVSSTVQDDNALPYVTINANGYNHSLQNGYASFAYCQQYYAFDMPAKNYSIDGAVKVALGLKKLKIQEVQFPQIAEPNLLQLIKTNLGNGKIRKMSLNLSSRSAKTTLEYDTE